MTKDDIKYYQYVLNTKNGKECDLIDNIGKYTFKRFQILGYIGHSSDGNFVDRWHITKFGTEQIKNALDMVQMKNELIDTCKTYDL